MNVQPIKTRIFREGESLFDFIVGKIPRLSEKSILVIASKIVSFSEKRLHEEIDKKTRERLIKAESQWAMKTKYTWLTIKDDTVMASAGIDRSNSAGKLALLPEDSFRTARTIRKKLQKHYRVKKLGVLITDSRSYPLRSGVVGVALGYAGFKGIRDYHGSKDIFGRAMKQTKTDVADSLANTATLVMGEGAERQPLAVIKEAPVVFTNRASSRRELYIDPREDLYQPLFERIKKIRLRKRRP